jgi:hypothetical protein
MKKFLPLVALLGAALCFRSVPANADPLMNYNYFDLAYEWVNYDDSIIDDSNGLNSQLSYAIIDNFAFEAGYEYKNAGSIDGQLFSYGGAYWYTVEQGLDLVARVGGLHARLETDEDESSDNGVYAGGEVRYLLTKLYELDGTLTYANIDETTWTVGTSLLRALSDSLALGGGVSINDDSDVALQVGLRLAF